MSGATLCAILDAGGRRDRVTLAPAAVELAVDAVSRRDLAGPSCRSSAGGTA